MRLPWKHAKDARDGREKAERELAETRARWPEVRRAADNMTHHLKRNHFGESLESIFAGRRP